MVSVLFAVRGSAPADTIKPRPMSPASCQHQRTPGKFTPTPRRDGRLELLIAFSQGNTIVAETVVAMALRLDACLGIPSTGHPPAAFFAFQNLIVIAGALATFVNDEPFRKITVVRSPVFDFAVSVPTAAA